MVKAWDDFAKAGKNFSNTNPAVLDKYTKLSEINKVEILKFSDKVNNSTLANFIDDLDDDIIDVLNKNEGISSAILGHKNGVTSNEFELMDEIIDDLEGISESTNDVIRFWVNRSAELSEYFGAARLGTQLGKNIVKSIEEGTQLKPLLESKLNVSLDDYVVMNEIPFKVPIGPNTPGGYMKADVVLVKYDIDGDIVDIIIIENKLNSSTNFTPAQELKFTEVRNAADNSSIEFEVKFDRPIYGLEAKQVLQVSKDKVIRISDSGTDDINSLSLSNIELVKNLNF